MINTNVTNFRADYNGLKEKLYLTRIPEMKDKLIKGKNTSKENCVAEKEVEL